MLASSSRALGGARLAVQMVICQELAGKLVTCRGLSVGGRRFQDRCPTSFPAALDEVQGAALDDAVEDVKVAGVWALHGGICELVCVPRAQADTHLGDTHKPFSLPHMLRDDRQADTRYSEPC